MLRYIILWSAVISLPKEFEVSKHSSLFGKDVGLEAVPSYQAIHLEKVCNSV